MLVYLLVLVYLLRSVPVFPLASLLLLFHEALGAHVRVHAHAVTTDARASFREEVQDAHAHVYTHEALDARVYIHEALAFLLPP